MTEQPRIDALYRYPVKGLTPEELDEVTLEPDGCFPFDRAYAIENGSRDFDPANPKHFPKNRFLMLMSNERLATLRSRFDPDTTVLELFRDGKQVSRGDLSTPAGRAIIEQFLAAYMKKDLRGSPRIVHAPGFTHSDYPGAVVSIINLASVRELEAEVGRPIDRLRFRGNIYVSGLDAWADHAWEGKRFAIGDVTFEGVMKTVRCAATNVDPVTGERDMAIPAALQRSFGHMDLGLYAKVVSGGTLKPGDNVTPPA